MKVIASVNEDNVISLNVHLEVGTLNQKTFLGNYRVVREALNESLINQIKEGNREGALETLDEMYKLRFWEMVGVEQGTIEIRDGELFGLNKRVELDDTLKARVVGAKRFIELNGKGAE
ncbi:hypothetical protein [Paenibacillus agilis]|uniref:Uncharacterized protein n=1 Tax=Paenibacillus agilis TaxID=3020863 RepID=A0A559IEF1_9BACL|nr:hypothetical protein [Paenibacillus agilis]TVX86037.1 hypothetical protein FPZ44_24145 [Paenibacillus agilis]